MAKGRNEGGREERAEAARLRAARRMERVDKMPRELRELVWEEGLTVVDQFVACGVKDVRRIRHLIRAVREGSVEIGDRNSTGTGRS